MCFMIDWCDFKSVRYEIYSSTPQLGQLYAEQRLVKTGMFTLFNIHNISTNLIKCKSEGQL
jgi:hypothetical protein